MPRMLERRTGCGQRPGAPWPLRALRQSLWALVPFLVIASLMGAYYIHYIGALTMPDPNMHPFGAYGLATGQAFNPVEHYEDSFGNDRALRQLTGDSRMLLARGASNQIVAAILSQPFPVDPARDAQIEACSGEGSTISYPDEVIEVDPETGETQPIDAIRCGNQYFPLVYLPQAIGMRAALSLGAGPYAVWQAGRVSSLVCYLVVYGLAIVAIPRMRSVLLVLGLVPTTVFMASSLMCDAAFISLATLSVALTLRAAERPGRVSRPMCLCLGLIAALMVLGKANYAPVCLGFLVMPHDRLPVRDKALALVPVAAAAGVYLAWSGSLSDMLYLCNTEASTAYVLAHPLTALARIAYAILNLPLVLTQLDASYTLAACLVALLLALQVGLSGLPARRPSLAAALSANRYVLGALAAGLVAVAAMFFFLLITWNDVASQPAISWIEGFQGRYLLPVWPLLCYLQTVLGPARRASALPAGAAYDSEAA